MAGYKGMEYACALTYVSRFYPPRFYPPRLTYCYVNARGRDDSRTFSAKEKDDETQYSYFGARYYDSDLSVWLSVDRFADKYPFNSPYSYALGNPIKYIDINGDSVYIYYVTGFIPHTAIGAKRPGDSKVTYYRAGGISVGNYEYVPNSDGNGGAHQEFVQDEGMTINTYVEDGFTVYRYAISLPSGVEENIKSICETNVSHGSWCTDEATNIIYDAYLMFGYSEEAAKQRANEIIPMTFPRQYHFDEAKDAGIERVDVFSKGEDGKTQQNTYYPDFTSGANTGNQAGERNIHFEPLTKE